MEARYNKENLIADVKRYKRIYGKYPRRVDWQKSEYYPKPITVIKYFGSWSNMLKEVSPH